ncbi:hypothetical protein A2U01_0028172, partial [Trifolium medium]|nr:hypothetical protein [Trifolium medium]
MSFFSNALSKRFLLKNQASSMIRCSRFHKTAINFCEKKKDSIWEKERENDEAERLEKERENDEAERLEKGKKKASIWEDPLWDVIDKETKEFHLEKCYKLQLDEHRKQLAQRMKQDSDEKEY